MTETPTLVPKEKQSFGVTQAAGDDLDAWGFPKKPLKTEIAKDWGEQGNEKWGENNGGKWGEDSGDTSTGGGEQKEAEGEDGAAASKAIYERFSSPTAEQAYQQVEEPVSESFRMDQHAVVTTSDSAEGGGAEEGAPEVDAGDASEQEEEEVVAEEEAVEQEKVVAEEEAVEQEEVVAEEEAEESSQADEDLELPVVVEESTDIMQSPDGEQAMHSVEEMYSPDEFVDAPANNVVVLDGSTEPADAPAATVGAAVDLDHETVVTSTEDKEEVLAETKGSFLSSMFNSLKPRKTSEVSEPATPASGKDAAAAVVEE